MGTISRRCSWFALLLGVAGLVSCAAGLEPPEETPEIFILEGLLTEYGEEAPCYRDDTEAKSYHDVLCQTSGDLPVELQQHMPLVQVQLSPFAIDQYEVSNAQYRHCVKIGTCREPLFTDSWNQGGDYYYNIDYDDYPVHQVTWQMAKDFCAFRGRRLPTDVEWQRVAQGSPVLRDELRKYPAENVEKLNDCQSKDITGAACNGKADLVQVRSETEDYVEEGFDKDLNPGKVYHLFNNVSEFTDGYFNEAITCKAELPTVNHTGPGGGAFEEEPDCIPCVDCLVWEDGSLERTNCDQECKVCESCAGTSVLGTAYMPEGYPEELVECHIDCWGETREAPRCVRWSVDEMPLPPEAVFEAEGNVDGTVQVSVRGGHVGIVSNSQHKCRFRSDHRAKRVTPDGSVSNGNSATEKGLGFRCARSLTDAERTTLMGHVQASRFDHLNPNLTATESAEFTQSPFSVGPAPAPDAGGSDTAPDAGGSDPAPDAGGPEPEPDPAPDAGGPEPTSAADASEADAAEESSASDAGDGTESD